MADIPSLAAAVDAAFAAEVEYARTRKPDGAGHSMPSPGQVRRMIEAAAPILAEVVAQKITAHAERQFPKSDPARAPGKPDLWRTWHRHFGIAARIAAGAFYTDEDMMRLAAEAIGRGEFIGCNPEVPDE